MTLVSYKIIAALLIFLVSVLTILYPLKQKRFMHREGIQLGEAFASGIFLGAAFFHMLPDSIESFTELYGRMSYPIPEFICIAGFLLLLFLERISLLHSPMRSPLTIPYVLAIILIFHAFIEGAALGIGTNLPATVMFFIAIVAHKGSESFALVITMMRHELPFVRILFIAIFFSLMTPLGIALGITINEFAMDKLGKLYAASFNAFAAGTFLYISTLHHIHFHQHIEDQQGMVEFASLVLGLSIMAAIALYV